MPVDYTGLVSRSRIPVVLPILSNSLWPRFCGQPFPSLKSNAQMMLLSEQPASWYLLPNFQGFLGTYIKPGHIYSLIHFDIDSSMQLIQLGKKLVPMFLFYIWFIPPRNNPNTGVGPPLCILGCKDFLKVPV